MSDEPVPKSRKSHLLIQEPPLQVLPSLAKAVGLNEAIVLQQIHYWLSLPKTGVPVDGRKWIYNTLEEWKRDSFPFWSIDTIGRALKVLVDKGVVMRARHSKHATDRTWYYTIDYDALNKLECGAACDDGAFLNLRNANQQLASLQTGKLPPSLSESSSETSFREEDSQRDSTLPPPSPNGNGKPEQEKLPFADTATLSDEDAFSTNRLYRRLVDGTFEGPYCMTGQKPAGAYIQGDLVPRNAHIAPPTMGRYKPKPPKPKNVQPPADVKDFIGILLHGASTGLLDSDYKIIVSLWNKLKCPSLEALQKFRKWWYESDWRGQKGQAPKHGQVVSEWSLSQNGNGKAPVTFRVSVPKGVAPPDWWPVDNRGVAVDFDKPLTDEEIGWLQKYGTSLDLRHTAHKREYYRQWVNAYEKRGELPAHVKVAER